jgi:UDP-GlcNAc:undecaprenyl-phosphate GlcNAc-1-phosphate transferase
MKNGKQSRTSIWRLLPLLMLLTALIPTILFAGPLPGVKAVGGAIYALPLYPVLLITAAVLSALSTPLVRLLALRMKKFVQLPRAISIDTHILPTPAAGGLAIYLGVAGSLLLAQLPSGFEKRVLVAGAVLVFFGLLDDSRALKIPSRLGGQFLARFLLDNRALSTGAKLIGQLLAAGLLLVVPGPGDALAVPLLFDNLAVNQVIAFLWLVGMINAVNFLDIMDGLAAGTSAITAFGFFVLSAFISDVQPIAGLAVALVGGALGFLIYNFEPASIFMGDTGSQFLGVVLGALSLHVASLSSSLTMVPPALVLLGIPLFEVAFTSTIRIWTGKLPWKGSKDHFPLRMFQRGLSVRRIVLTSYAVAFCLIPCAIVLMQVNQWDQLLILSLLAVSGVGAGLWLSQVKVPKASSLRARSEAVVVEKPGQPDSVKESRL